ncbi:Nuclear receptor corepressor 1 [Linum perenne]
MPPEPLPWDRKKHERSESSSSLGSTPRWRDWSSAHYGSYRDSSPRWAGGSNEFRRPSGHGKQGSWHLFAEESGYGYGPSRSNDKVQEDNNGRTPFSRGDGKYSRSGRDSRGPSGQRDWRAHSWDMCNGSTNGPGRPHDVSNDQRSVDDMLTCPPSHPPNSDFVNTWDQLQCKQQHGNSEGGGNALGSGQRGDKDNSLDWKPLKWTRTGSLSSRGSGFSHSSSSKSLGLVKANGGKTEVIPRNGTQILSPSGDEAAACAASVTLSDETMSRKKPRLKWGEGLAKYEKKTVEGPETSVTRDDATLFTSNVEPVHSTSSSLPDKSPRQMVFPECVSPATPSSVACSSSPGIEDKVFCKAVNVDNDASNLCGSPGVGSQGHFEGFSFNLETLDMNSIPNLGSSLIEMIQSEDLCSVDSSFVKSTRMNKLLVWKGDALKALEATETEIDMLENELKLLKSDSKNKLSCPLPLNSLAMSVDAIACGKQENICGDYLRPPPLQMLSSMDEAVGGIPNPDDDFEDGCAKDDDIDSPGTATSKFVEPVLSVRTLSDTVRCIQHSDVAATESSNLVHKKQRAVSACDVSIIHCNNNVLFSATKSSVVDGYSNLCTAILASNKGSACTADEEFNRLLPREPCSVDCSGLGTRMFVQTDASIMKKFLMRRRFLKFKEKMVALKFKALQHLWREDMHLISIKKFKAKSQKKLGSSLRPVHNMHKKHRSSSRMRICSPGSMSLVLSPEMLNFTSKLLADCNVKVYRDNLKMPIQILDDNEKIVSRFISGNGLVEDPFAVERERAMINPWSSEECEVFIDKLATCGKDFKKIASFLEHKTTADCVEFYYKNHKSDSFGKVKKNKQLKSSTNYLMSSGKKWNREMSTAPPDVLGATSGVAADSDQEIGSKKMLSSKIFIRRYNKCKILQGDEGNSERSNNYDVLVNERETAAADVLAGISGSMSSCITSSADRAEGFYDYNVRKRDTSDRRPSISDVTQNVDEDTCSDESCGEMDPADWTDEEKAAFVRAVSLYGKDFVFISHCVRTRSQDQCKVFYSKARKCLGLDHVHSGIETVGPSLSEDPNGGGSDMEDAIVDGLEEIPSNMDLDLPPQVMSTAGNTKQDVTDGGVGINLETDLNLSDEKDAAGAIEEEDLMTVDTVVSSGSKDHLLQSTHLGNGEIINGVGHISLSVNGLKVPIESVVAEGERDCGTNDGFLDSAFAVDSVDSGPSNLVSVFRVEAPRDILVKGCSNSKSEQTSSLPQCQSTSQNCLTRDLNTTKEVPHLPSDMGSSSDDSSLVENIAQRQVEMNSVENSVSTFLQSENKLASAVSVTLNSAVIHCDKVHELGEISGSVQENCSKQKYSCGSGYVQSSPCHPMANHQEPSEIDSGRSKAQTPTEKVMTGNISDAELHLNGKKLMANQSVAESLNVEKSSNSRGQCLVPELPLLSQHSEKGSDQPRSLTDMKKPTRNGDVKLFGKILSNPVSSRKPAVGHEIDEKRSSTLKLNGHHPSAEGNVASLNFDKSSCPGVEKVPIRSYGFWDGSRIQTGLTSLPDSAILLAKYPAAFGNFEGSSSKLDPVALPTTCKNGRVAHQRGDVSSSSAVVEFQRYITRDGTNKVEPYMVDRKDVADLQVGKGLKSTISSLQQEGGRTVGIAAGRGVVVSGACQAVSDPVAAMKMHFAKADHQFGKR